MQAKLIVYVDESFVDQAHGSVYSCFLTGKNGEVDSTFGRATGKGQRMITGHAITKWGTLVTRASVGDLPDRKGVVQGEVKG